MQESLNKQNSKEAEKTILQIEKNINDLKNDVKEYKRKIIFETERRTESEKEILRLKVAKHNINKSFNETLSKIDILEKKLLNFKFGNYIIKRKID